MTRKRAVQADVVDEFAGAELDDPRRSRRLASIASKLMAAPDVGFPEALATEADLEGFYRFLRNDAVTFESVLKVHVTATIARAAAYKQVLAIHDTSEFRFGGRREDLGRLKESGHGFLGHFTLAVTQDEDRDPLGTLAVETWTRTAPTPTALRREGKLSYAETRELPNEQDRWFRAVEAAEKATGFETSLVHVMDSEADDYKLMSNLVESQRRWIIRLCYDRVLAGLPNSPKTKEVVAKREVLCKRTVKLSRRKRQPGGERRSRAAIRSGRTAMLTMSAGSVVFRRPAYCCKSAPTLPVNVVHVRELAPPRDEDGVEWFLVTTESVDTEADVLKVVDSYRARWRIEEFFKALKTGCAFEKRQLESRQTLLTALAIFIPIAWNLLRLRTLARSRSTCSARTLLSVDQIRVLRASSPTPLPRVLTSRHALRAIARLGGHLRSNGDPGWQVLGRGYQDLLMLVAGFRLATENM
jgi:hypothetical protein